MKSILLYIFFFLLLLPPVRGVAQNLSFRNEIPDSLDRGALHGDLQEFVVKKKRWKYSKRNNPAVDFISRLRKEATEKNPFNQPYYSYDKYEKTVIGLNDFHSDMKSGFMKKRGRFLQNFVDTNTMTGKQVLDLALMEKKSTVFKGPHGSKEITDGYRSVGMFDGLSQDKIRTVLEDALRDINIFSNDIVFLQNRFVSPLSRIGPDFYKYYLTDTIPSEDGQLVELTFVPHNPESMGFNGKIYVMNHDSVSTIQSVKMRLPRAANLNYVDNIFIEQEFITDSLDNLHKIIDDISLEMQIAPGTPKIFGRKTTLYSDFSYQPRADLASLYEKSGKTFEADSALVRKEAFWVPLRQIPLTATEKKIDGLAHEMRKVPLFYWGEKFISLMESGYVRTGNPSRVDLGPLNTLLSVNSIEGLRIRVGAMTMSALNPHFFTKGYVAWGTKDHRWKGGLDVEYSFTKKKKHSYEWPRHGFYAGANHDLDLIGQHYLFTNQDNFFLSLKRRESNLVTYRTLVKTGYILELPNHFSIDAGVRWERQEATRWLPFVRWDGVYDRFYRQCAGHVTLRYAPGEKFIQGRTLRLPVNMDAWIFQLSQEWGPKGFFGSSFTINKTEISLQKRLWFSAFGYLDLIAKGGIVWTSVPYPALMWPNANLSYTIQPESYSLMNPMEFANDRYTAVDVTYFGNGVIFNRIPLIKKLKMREVFTFKGLKGWLSNKNNPEYNKDLYLFPVISDSQPMGKRPYMEVGVGLDNILTFLRVDYIWRLTYRNTPGCDRSGVRISLHFSF